MWRWICFVGFLFSAYLQLKGQPQWAGLLTFTSFLWKGRAGIVLLHRTIWGEILKTILMISVFLPILNLSVCNVLVLKCLADQRSFDNLVVHSHFYQLGCQAFNFLHPTFNNSPHKNLPSQKVLYVLWHQLSNLTIPASFFFLFHLWRGMLSSLLVFQFVHRLFPSISNVIIKYILRWVFNNLWL